MPLFTTCIIRLVDCLYIIAPGHILDEHITVLHYKAAKQRAHPNARYMIRIDYRYILVPRTVCTHYWVLVILQPVMVPGTSTRTPRIRHRYLALKINKRRWDTYDILYVGNSYLKKQCDLLVQQPLFFYLQILNLKVVCAEATKTLGIPLDSLLCSHQSALQHLFDISTFLVAGNYQKRPESKRTNKLFVTNHASGRQVQRMG